MNDAEKLIAKFDLIDNHCYLNHGPDIDTSEIESVEQLVCPIGYNESDIVTVVKRELIIPICEECANALCENEWLLIYCIECNNNHWINREYASNKYHPSDHIIWLKGCPECTKKFGGIYFQRN